MRLNHWVSMLGQEAARHQATRFSRCLLSGLELLLKRPIERETAQMGMGEGESFALAHGDFNPTSVSKFLFK